MSNNGITSEPYKTIYGYQTIEWSYVITHEQVREAFLKQVVEEGNLDSVHDEIYNLMRAKVESAAKYQLDAAPEDYRETLLDQLIDENYDKMLEDIARDIAFSATTDHLYQILTDAASELGIPMDEMFGLDFSLESATDGGPLTFHF